MEPSAPVVSDAPFDASRAAPARAEARCLRGLETTLGGGALSGPLGAVIGRLPRDPQSVSERGIDRHGYFHAPSEQPLPPPHVWLLLEDLDLAEAILMAGDIVALDVLEDNHTVFRGLLRLSAEHAALLGRESIRVAFKPAGTSLYGKEYRRELAYYKLARTFSAGGTIPLVERCVAWRPLAESVWEQLSDKQRRTLQIFDSATDAPSLYGTVQLWVEGYEPRIGYLATSHGHLQRLAQELRPGRKMDIENDPLWRGLSDMFVMDYLVGHNDRSLEVGTVRLPNGGQRIVYVDNGDAFLGYNRHEVERSQTLVEMIEVFSPNALHALATLDLATLQGLMVDSEGQALVPAAQLDRAAQRARELRRKTSRSQRRRRHGGGVFAKASRVH